MPVRGQIQKLKAKADWVWRRTVLIHGSAPEARIASSLSPVEVLVALYYGGILKYNAANPLDEKRDRFIISKGHGSISMYPILADLGFFGMECLDRVCKQGSFLGGIPDPIVPGYETVNGSLGHGAGVACGVALALKRKKSRSRVFVLLGDGELHEGAVWEAVMFAGHHALDNLTFIVDSNTKCMLNYSTNVMDMFPLAPRFEAFGWSALTVDGHDMSAVMAGLRRCTGASPRKPRVMIANTIKGHGVPALVADPICHVKTLKPDEAARIAAGGPQ